MVINCHDCNAEPQTPDEKFYLVRVTDSGKDFTAGMLDFVFCGSCLLARVNSGAKLGRVQSILRIEDGVIA